MFQMYMQVHRRVSNASVVDQLEQPEFVGLWKYKSEESEKVKVNSDQTRDRWREAEEKGG